jgi:hypothetical protein
MTEWYRKNVIQRNVRIMECQSRRRDLIAQGRNPGTIRKCEE